MSRDSSINPHPENSLEVISDGILADIARPSLSRGSTRSISQLSMQSTNISSFELESLPGEHPSLKSHEEEELYLEEAVVDYDDDCDIEVPDSSWQHAASSIISTCPSKALEKLEELSSPDLDSKEFEKEIFKMSKRFNKTKQLREKPILMEETVKYPSPSPSTERSKSRNSISETVTLEQDVDPKVYKGMEKIRKLDEILAEKIKLEKEAKAERKRLEQEWQLEIKGFVEWCGDKKSKPIIQQFLALTNGISDHHPVDEDEVKPLFQTEIQTDFLDVSNGSGGVIGNGRDLNENEESPANEANVSNDAREVKKGSLQNGKNEKSRKKDFIKRNIVLAAHANEIVSLTESEKQRLDELLSDESDLLLVENPFSKTDQHKTPSGYELDEDAKKALTDIDEKLKCLVPQSDFQSICLSPVSDDQLLTGRTSNSFSSSKQAGEITGSKYGDGILKQEKQYRYMEQRLQQIEAELKRIDQLENTELHSDTPSISGDLLRQLLEVDSWLTSSALSILDSARSNLNTARSDISREDLEPYLDGESCLDSSRISHVEKSYNDIGV